MPDLVEVDKDSAISLLADGTIQDISQFNPDLSKLNPNVVDSFKVGDQLAAIPFQAAPQVLIGAKWYSVKGDKWVIDINGPESKKAVDYLQQIVDNDMFSQKTFIEWDALMQFCFKSFRVHSWMVSSICSPVTCLLRNLAH